MERGLEEWLRGDAVPLYPEDMGLPVVREFLRRRDFSDMSMVEFLGGYRSGGEIQQDSGKTQTEVLTAPADEPADVLDGQVLSDLTSGGFDAESKIPDVPISEADLDMTSQASSDSDAADSDVTADASALFSDGLPEKGVQDVHAESLDAAEIIPQVNEKSDTEDEVVSEPDQEPSNSSDQDKGGGIFETETPSLAPESFEDRDDMAPDAADLPAEPALEPEVPSNDGQEDQAVLETEALALPKPEARPQRKLAFLGAALALGAAAAGGLLLVKANSPERTIEKAQIFFEKGDFAKALELYGKIDDKVSIPVSHLVRRGDAFSKTRRNAEALDSYYEALSCAPESSDIHVKIAETFLALGSSLQAEKAYSEALKLSPDRETVMKLSELRIKRGDLEGALSVLEDAKTLRDGEIDDLAMSLKAQLAPPEQETIQVSMDLPPSSLDLASAGSIAPLLSEDFQVPGESAESSDLDLPEVLIAQDIPKDKAAPGADRVPDDPKAHEKKEKAGRPEKALREIKADSQAKAPVPESRRASKPKAKPVQLVAGGEGKFRDVLLSGRDITRDDGPALRRLASEPESKRSLYRLGRMYNKAGRPKDALLFLEKGLALDGDDLSMLLEAAYSYGAVGKNDEALSLVRHGLVKGKNLISDGPPPSSIVSFPSSMVWDIGWDRPSAIAEQVPLYCRDRVIEEIAGGRYNFDRYGHLQKAIVINPKGRSLYMDFMVLWPKSEGYSPGYLAAGAMALESHSLIMAGERQKALEAIEKALDVAPQQPLLVEMKENLF